MAAENLAKVVQDLRAGRTQVPDKRVWLPDRPEINVVQRLEELRKIDIDRSRISVVIDAQRFYEQITTKATSVYDHNMMPVWENAIVAYENEWGNINVACVVMYPHDPGDPRDRWESDNPVEWARVAYVYFISAYAGGRAGAGTGGPSIPVPTQGPMFLWRVAVYGDGTVADINWQNVLAFEENELFDNLMLCVLKAYDLGNCVNVELAVPTRPRSERRRIERTGVTVSEIHVRSISKTYRHDKGPVLNPGVPLSSVRGHHAHYGPKYDRKLLFGKYEGRFWIPQHARGSEELGVVPPR